MTDQEMKPTSKVVEPDGFMVQVTNFRDHYGCAEGEDWSDSEEYFHKTLPEAKNALVSLLVVRMNLLASAREIFHILNKFDGEYDDEEEDEDRYKPENNENALTLNDAGLEDIERVATVLFDGEYIPRKYSWKITPIHFV